MSQPIIVRARMDASRNQNLNEYRLSRDLDTFEEAYEATRRHQMLAGMQPRRSPYLLRAALWLALIGASIVAGWALHLFEKAVR